jgi:hypothetical protein
MAFIYLGKNTINHWLCQATKAGLSIAGGETFLA